MTKCQVCNKLPKVLGVNSREGTLIICEECDRRNNPYYYQELPPPIEEIYENPFEALGL